PNQQKMYYIGDQPELHLPGWKNKMLSITRYEGNWFLEPLSDNVYLNGEKLTKQTVFCIGDTVFCENFFLILDNQDILVSKFVNSLQLDLPQINKPTSVMKQKYPNYRRTPRMIYDLPDDKI